MIDQILQELESRGWSWHQSFLSEAELTSLQFLFEQDFYPAKVGKGQQRQRMESIRGDLINWIDPTQPPDALARPLSFIKDLQMRINQRFFLGLKEFECHLARYAAGSFYRCHSDQFNSDSSRTISFIFYLHQQWQKEDGGELVLYDKNQNIIESILPLPGSFICFLSADFPHEVKICHKERRSLTGWMHNKIIS
jgi:SM-20-related protein